MRRHQRWKCAAALGGLVWLLGHGQALAGDGWYMGMDVGAALGMDRGLDVDGTDNDYSTQCDTFINPMGVEVSMGECDAAPAPASLLNEFDGGGGGVLAGLQAGYRWRNFRIEGEYFYRGATYDQADEVFVRGQDQISRTKLNQELAAIEGAVDDVFSHNFFANLYYDFRSKSRWTPYLGVGVGVARVSMDYFTRWTRSSNPDDISTFCADGAPLGCSASLTGNAVDATNELAGTTTIGRGNFSDVLLGVQAIAGVDYQMIEPVTVGLKVRWAGFSEFEDGEEYDALRSHDSTNSSDPADPRSARVRYGISTDDLSFWGVSLNMKYQFGAGAPVSFVADRTAYDRWYLGMDLGVALAQDLDTNGRDNDLPTRCDQFITMAGAPASCPAGQDRWTNQFDAGAGVLAGLQVGYRWRDFRVEGEYFYRDANHDQAREPFFPGVGNLKDLQEIAESEEVLDDVLSHNFFANLYYDFRSESRWTPYVGVGVGFARVQVDYFSRFRRSSDANDIMTTFDPSVNEAEARERLAGTTTIGRNKLADTLLGWQILAGVDYRLSEPASLGLKFRWADFTNFVDGEEWTQLRSHDSTNSPDPTDPRSARVRYRISTSDIAFWGLTLNLKYHF